MVHESLNIGPTEETPAVDFNTNGTLLLGQRSLPEDAVEFYLPLLSWLEGYLEQPEAETTLVLKLEYYNTTSAKQLFKLLTLLEAAAEKSKVLVQWCFEMGDEDMRFAGERFARLVDISFEIIEVEELLT
jgi:hypothetical protein